MNCNSVSGCARNMALLHHLQSHGLIGFNVSLCQYMLSTGLLHYSLTSLHLYHYPKHAITPQTKTHSSAGTIQSIGQYVEFIISANATRILEGKCDDHSNGTTVCREVLYAHAVREVCTNANESASDAYRNTNSNVVGFVVYSLMPSTSTKNFNKIKASGITSYNPLINANYILQWLAAFVQRICCNCVPTFCNAASNVLRIKSEIQLQSCLTHTVCLVSLITQYLPLMIEDKLKCDMMWCLCALMKQAPQHVM